jgi:hypothetical protein
MITARELSKMRGSLAIPYLLRLLVMDRESPRRSIDSLWSALTRRLPAREAPKVAGTQHGGAALKKRQTFFSYHPFLKCPCRGYVVDVP